jgi:hypothetical protein
MRGRRTGWNQRRRTGLDRILHFGYWFWVWILAAAAVVLIIQQIKAR